MTTRIVAYVGNFGPEHSTENDIRRALLALGHEVVPLQENERDTWRKLASIGSWDHLPDLVLWTRTWSLDVPAQLAALEACRDAGVPVVGYHLDRWFGLSREHEVRSEPFFAADVVVTADGGHQAEFQAAGVTHWWAPPAVLGLEVMRTRDAFVDPMVPDVVFVGSWQRYHEQWPWRRQLVRQLTRTYGRKFGAYPRVRGQAVRGEALSSLYRSAQVVVGDSCLAGSPSRYWSDRIPETVGRGGFLIHPYVDGIEDHYTDGEHLVLVEPGNWSEMDRAVRHWLARPDERRRIAAAGQAHVLEHHTYERRMEWLLDELVAQGYINDDKEGAPMRARTKEGVTGRFALRENSTDAIVVRETWTENVYNLTTADVAGKVVVDLGGNVGAFSVWAARAGARFVMAVEPVTSNMDTLLENARLSGVNVASLRRAVSDHRGQLQVVHVDGNQGSAHLAPMDELVGEGMHSEVVEVVTLADVLEAAGGHIHVLKVDIEGGEYDALAGAVADGTLDHVDKIVAEWHPLADHITAGRFLCGLLRYGTLHMFGDPANGGQFTWTRYGA